jgi:thioredoxin reductase
VAGGFDVATERGGVHARCVVLAVGRRGTPRKLGVPGEDTHKVAYRLLEPERWTESLVLVVGGGNSSVEAAAALAEAGARVTLSYRGRAFNRVAAENRARLEAQRGRRLEVLLESHVRCIEPDRVVIETPTGERSITNDQVFILIGGQPPSEFLTQVGVQMRWHYGERQPAPAGGRP